MKEEPCLSTGYLFRLCFHTPLIIQLPPHRLTCLLLPLQIGRTHTQDATPLTLGQEFGGYATQVRGVAWL